jgi:hypothetical protein
MHDNLLDCVTNDNPLTEPDMLIIHCPRVVQAAPWGDWAIETLSYLKGLGWIERRERDAVHVISPLHPAMGRA